MARLTYTAMSKLKIAYFPVVWPVPTASAASVRSVGFLRALVAAGHQVSILCSGQARLANTFVDSFGHTLGMPVAVQLNDPAASSAVQAALAGPRALAIYDTFVKEEQWSHVVHATCPDAGTVCDTQDLHAVRAWREQAAMEWADGVSGTARPALVPPTAVAWPNLQDKRVARELAAMQRCDVSWLCSTAEMEHAASCWGMPPASLYRAGFWFPPPADTAPEHAARDFNKTSGFVWIGNFRHAPNAQAVRTLCYRIWPALRESLQAAGEESPQLHIYGAFAKGSDAQVGSLPGVRWHGAAASVETVMQRHRVLIAPLQFGAGVKGKILDAWRAGRPAVTTSVGLEGIPIPAEVTNVPGMAACDSDSEFIRTATDLYCNHAAWQAARHAGASVVAQHFNDTSGAAELVLHCEELVESLSQRRAQNPVRAALWHASAEYTALKSRNVQLRRQLRASAGATLDSNARE